ncbi:cap-specific mRNA (nucleoside-2'-O-)-methyltransferase 1-like [Saccoglossus kowalevskii]|uniref:Cap-specific mRNA (nucleoside-2'-O-)-methyltransferase 1 n=1 Tax=Saccoglossus kowalevskii TaxID=10224 RepID=A0ABM0GVA2_SACKO|nr:PREDICTED: cap-specific mRNA (nucleoside-2'-O-)-methyltransferase 1-like [Saccoglossus kowalevskii]
MDRLPKKRALAAVGNEFERPEIKKRRAVERLSSESSEDDSDSDGLQIAGFGFGGGEVSTFQNANTSSPSEPEAVPHESKYNPLALKMMQKMGYRKGKGLGKHGEGRVDIVEASKQRGRRGLGLVVEGFEGGEDVNWEDEEEASSDETVDWLPQCHLPIPEYEECLTWMEQGPRKRRIDDENEFCNPQTLMNLLACKSTFDKLDSEEMRQARTRSNPYETIRGGIFLNRAAMKMANMDYVFDFMFTNPKTLDGQPLVKGNELLYFADICAGPGGFSEYVLWRKNWHAKGFGFTLKGANDFKLEDFFSTSPELFEPYYGVDGIDGDGNIYRSDNLKEFQRFVLQNTDGKGVHFVMADGGFSVAGQENIQEILSKQLLLCQFLCALSIIREGGNFVCKTFDLFTPFSVGLIYLLYRAFQRVTLFKPVTSRPANSERYVVCQGLRSDTKPIHDYLFEVNIHLNKLENTNQDITDVVPLEMIKEDRNFFEYVTKSHESLAIQQARALKKIQAYAQNTNLFDSKQADMRKECLRKWGIPGDTRSAPKISSAMDKFYELTKERNNDYFHFKATKLSPEILHQKLHSVYDYRCMISSGERCFILSLGRSHVYKWDGNISSRWTKLIDTISLEIPKNSLIEAEITQELKGEGRGQRKIQSVHILDVMCLGGEDLRNLHFNERMLLAEKFVKAIHKPSRSDLAALRTKHIYKMEDLHMLFKNLEMKVVKGSREPRLCYTTKNGRYILPTGVYFVKTTKDPWMMQLSRTHKRKYFYDTQTRQSVFETPSSSIAGFKDCRTNRYHWIWESGVKVHEDQGMNDEDKISKAILLEFIEHKIQR